MTGDVEGLRPEMITALKTLEGRANVGPFQITSGLRPNDVGSPHQTGLAVDIAVWGGIMRRKLVEAALLDGWRRIGVYDRHVHLDMDPHRVQDVLWAGKSR